MCGIAGVFLHQSEMPERERLQQMGDVMRYRGPDDEGFFLAPHIGLVHRRLSIRDLSPAGRCPMASADGLIQVIFNGEIYNWRELRRALADAGIVFVTQSDTEVILYGYLSWGQEVISRLRGMFAIAIWDGRTQRLLLARDRAGEKPLFYYRTPRGLAFASSVEALRSRQLDNRIDPTAMGCYLSHSFIPSPHTIWEGIQVLPPAHTLSVAPFVEPVVSRYWDFPRVGPARKTVPECEAEVNKALDDAVVECLDADVPVGVFLSGGVDSSLIAALAARHRPGIEAFSLGFSEVPYSELPYARRVAAHLGLSHHLFEITADDVVACLPHLVKQYGQPFGDASAVPSYLLARLTRKHVKVCLSGDGGDESFGGYWRLQTGVYSARYGKMVPRAVREHWVPRIAGCLGPLSRRWLALNTLSLSPPGAGFTNSLSWFNQLKELSGPALSPVLHADLAALRVGHALGRPGGCSVVQRILYDDFQVQLPDAYLTKVDVASMAASLEVRAPFLDQRVIELAWGLPDWAKLNWWQLKWLLKRIAARYIPPEVIYRPKMGFAMPLPQWFRAQLGEVLEGLLKDSVAAKEGWIQLEPVRRCLEDHRKGEDHATRLWLILWLELWFRLVVYADKCEGWNESYCVS
ncbi:Asparagine synthetase [glutamine-hydrolyzing] 1 [Candidatus Methylomirabilis lanthanidiphila]|uniref:asparagine synthase (glutamine-hydrolyzing) n=1 Tax=Candidatus Methylomirabilis lanthanidiphila TaxID=2211376 RepID=A0A564ZHK9_9BACT|nr:Asparagine synthetase [glutamine-hydrolyzing] 1 [Candidatus Methylomirabilis lanthanidiphila]